MDIRTIAEKHGVSLADVFSRKRTDRIALARHEAFYWLWKENGWTLKEIGELFDKNLTTVHYGIQKVIRSLK